MTELAQSQPTCVSGNMIATFEERGDIVRCILRTHQFSGASGRTCVWNAEEGYNLTMFDLVGSR